MRRLATWMVFSVLAVPLTAQRSLTALQQQFQQEAQQLQASGNVDQAKQRQLLDRQVEALQKFVADEAQGDDRWNGRLMLADLQMARGDRKAAGDAIAAIDKTAAPALVMTTAAAMAQHLGLRELRDALVAAASSKDAPLADRLAIARMLITVLLEVERGEALFAKALADAGDDEQRAFVRWHRADAMRDREDLPDNAGFEELEKVAKDLPNTYWGSVAKDRLRATRLRPGDDAIDFVAKSLDGTDVSAKTFAGKTLVLAFWSAADRDLPTLLQLLRDLKRSHGDRLAVLAVGIDPDPRIIEATVKELGIEFPVIGDGKGVMTDVALRWFVEGPTVHVIDGKGKIAAMGLHAGTADGRAQLTETVQRSVGS